MQKGAIHTLNIDDFKDRLDGPHDTKGEQFRCPAHEDNVASLSVSDGGDKILIYCHAGCHYEDVLKAMDLKPKNLYYDDSEYSKIRIYDTEGKISKAPMTQPEAIYDYTDENGTLLYQVVRFPNKRFRQRMPDGTWGLNGVKKVPYNLPNLVHTPMARVYIVEGEKDVETLRKGFNVATCFMGGAGRGKFLARYVKYFQGRDVVIIADNDLPGKQYAEEIEDALQDVAFEVRIMLPKGKDITEHLENGYNLRELEPYVRP